MLNIKTRWQANSVTMRSGGADIEWDNGACGGSGVSAERSAPDAAALDFCGAAADRGQDDDDDESSCVGKNPAELTFECDIACDTVGAAALVAAPAEAAAAYRVSSAGMNSRTSGRRASAG